MVGKSGVLHVYDRLAYPWMIVFTISSALLCSCAVHIVDIEQPSVFLKKNIKSAVVYEGLPHQMWEFELLEEQKLLSKNINLHDFPFYDPPQVFAPRDLHHFLRILESPTGVSFSLADSITFCGGFHPDFCILITTNKSVTHYQICFGCDQIRKYLDSERSYILLDKEPMDDLIQMLKKYRKFRPKSEHYP